MKNKILVINQKTYMDIKDVYNYIKKVEDNDNIIICPETIYIPFFLNHYKNIGIQNIYSSSDICTGSNSLFHAKKLGVNYAIVGHSECRENFNINDDIVNKQIELCTNSGITPIMCVGESIDDKNNNDTKKVIKKQINVGLNDIKCDKIIIAYEPIYAIGSGCTPTNSDISNTISYIKEVIKDMNVNASILYGGSVNSSNITELSKIDILDGFMVGKSGTEVNEVIEMIKLLSS